MKRGFSIFILVISLITILCVFCVIIGSLEMFPNEEQIGKVRLVYSILTIFFLIIDVVLISIRIYKIYKTWYYTYIK